MRRRSVSDQELAYYRAHFLEALREDGVVCLECGILYRFLGRHVRQHGLTLVEYREKWGYNRSTALITPALHEAQRQRALARDFGAFGAPNLRRNAPERRQRFNPAPRREALLHLSVAVKARYAAGARPPGLKVADETLRALVAAGLTSREIAARAGLHRNYLGRRLHALGLRAALPPVKATNATLLALRREGLPDREIAARTGMRTGTVCARFSRLRRAGGEVPPIARRSGRPRRVSDEQVVAFVRDGLRRGQIAARVGHSPGTVTNRLRALRRRGLLPPAAPGASGRARRGRRRSLSADALEDYRAHLLGAIGEDAVVCLECGVLYRFLAPHVRRHGLTYDDYREKWGYNRGTVLMIPDLRDARRQLALAQNAIERLPGPPESLWNLWEARGRFTGPRRLEDRLTQSARMRARFAAGARPSNLKVEDETLRTLVAEGRTSRAIAEHTGLSYRWVRERLRALGLAPPDFVPPEHNRINSALLALRRQGLWISEIAARTGMTICAVGQRLRWLRRRGVAVPRPAGPRPNAKRRVSDEQILGLVHEGLRASEIAARVGITYQGVRYRLGALRRRGVLPPAPSRPTEPPNS